MNQIAIHVAKTMTAARPTQAVAVAMRGCRVTHRTPWVNAVGERKLGHPHPDFTFMDENGKADTFSHIRRGVPLVVFPDDPKWPNCSQCRALVDMAAKVQEPDTPVTVVSIQNPETSSQCEAATLHSCAIQGPAQLVVLCDHHSSVKDLFGSDALDKFFVVANDGRIVGHGSLANLDVLEWAVRMAVWDHEQEVKLIADGGDHLYRHWE